MTAASTYRRELEVLLARSYDAGVSDEDSAVRAHMAPFCAGEPGFSVTDLPGR